MALTQSMVQMPGPSWDEEVVPALRKRLESESRTLARRMSAVSISSLEEANATAAQMDSQPHDRPSTSTTIPSYYQPPSNTLRPHLSSGRTSSARSRTYSQPYAHHKTNGPNQNNNASYYIKPTRIPRAHRSPSIASSKSHSNAPAPYRTSLSSHPDITQSQANLWIVQESRKNKESPSSVSVVSHKSSGILNEPPPFQPASTSSSLTKSQQFVEAFVDPDNEPPRPSMESEERPYEHWYRGEVSRNGGVGELRVAKRMEMLEIANYGHRQKPQAPNAITQAINERRRQRKRADSLDSLRRGSLYLDEDEHTRAMEQVMDEDPLTDLERDQSDMGHAQDHMEYYRDYYDLEDEDEDEDEEDYTISHSRTLDAADLSTASAPMSTTPAYDPRSVTPTPSTMMHREEPVTPRASSRQASQIPRTSTSSYVRGQSEPPSLPSSSQSKPSTSQSHGARLKTLQGKRGTSPNAPPSASKKARTEAAKATRAKTEAAARKQVETEKRRSMAYYPAIEGELEDAIPTWTQPVHGGGNWDEVVLPVVARKKGLDGQYEQGDGSPKPKPESPVEPAPGTFGYDFSKYRPPRAGDEFIPMDEFGRQDEQDDSGDGSSPSKPRVQPISTTHDETPVGIHRPQPPKSPAPFSHYHTQEAYASNTTPSKLEQQDLPEHDDEKNARCCKCVVM